MLAAHLVQPGQIEIIQVPKPTPRSGELVVRVDCALTCGTDLKAYRRGHPLIPMPGPFGHQWTGVIDQISDDETTFKIGMPVMGTNSGPCLKCHFCRKQRYNLCPLIHELVLGAFGEYLLVPQHVASQNVLPRPENVSPVRAAFLEPVSCVIHALQQIQWDRVHRVLILGLGSMGILFARLISAFSPAVCVGAGKGLQRLSLAESSGLEIVLDRTSETAIDTIIQAGPFDLVIECTGKPEGWEEALNIAESGAQVMFFGGLPKGTQFPVDTYRVHYEELHLMGSFHFGPPDVQQAAEWIVDKSLQVEDLVTDCVGLGELEKVLKSMAENQGVKYAIEPFN